MTTGNVANFDVGKMTNRTDENHSNLVKQLKRVERLSLHIFTKMNNSRKTFLVENDIVPGKLGPCLK